MNDDTKQINVADLIGQEVLNELIETFNKHPDDLHQCFLTILEPHKDKLLAKGVDHEYLAYAIEAEMFRMSKRKATCKPGTRVRVHDGSGKNLLGLGTYEGDVKVYFIVMPDGSLQSNRNAEEEPTPDMIPPGAEVFTTEDNPKIRLDSGEVVYGCQVWWEALKNE